MLAEQVAKGELPPVEERLPKDPMVVEPVDEIGEYGGNWRRMAVTRSDSLLANRLGYEALVRWDRKGGKPVPGIAKRWTVADGGRTFTLYLREGIKWSDGRPFTTEDFIFWYDDEVCNKEMTPNFPSWLGEKAEDCRVTALSPYILEFRFKNPNGLFIERLCTNIGMFSPRHYMMQFHPKYTDRAELDARAEEAGFYTWTSYYVNMENLTENPEIPTIRPWVLKQGPPNPQYIAERNPFYWKVDSEGNQLPYIDRITSTVVQNSEVLNLKAMSGEVDMQARYIDPSKYTLFMDPGNRTKGNYHVQVDPGDNTLCIFLNQYSKDPEMRALLQDRRFRIALSVAVNREEIVDLIYDGLAEPSRAVASPNDPYWLPRFGDLYIEYDPDKANRLLDELGLKRGRDGMRRMPSGKPFRRVLFCYPSEGGATTDLWMLITDYWREVGLDFVMKIDARTISVMRVSNGNSDFWAYEQPGIHWALRGYSYVPLHSWSYFAPLYGRYILREGEEGLSPEEAGERPSPEIRRLVDWYKKLEVTADNPERKLELGQNILNQWAEECYVVGVVRQSMLTIISNRFKNVPDRIIHSWQLYTPGYMEPEQFFIEQGE